MSHFHCYQCGACCRVPEVMAQFPHLDRGDGTCRHLIDNRCSIYNDRPLICRVDECYEQLFKNVMTREEYYELQNNYCKQLRKQPMIEIKTLEIAGMASVLQALRLPFGLECRSKCSASHYRFPSEENAEYTEFNTRSECLIHEKDIKLLSTLIRRGDEHAKAIRGLIVYAEINAPRFWWVEMDTYRIGSERLASESTMHIQGKGLTTEKLVEMKSNLTEGTMQRRIQYFSYQTLRRIYHQRITHRLPHWRKFCEWIETLPFFDELILSNKYETKI